MGKYLNGDGVGHFWLIIKSYITNAISGFYTKPSGGIPSSDLADAVQTALTSAGTAYQKPSGGIPSTDLASAVQTSLGKADTALQSYTETDPVFIASAAYGISSSDITAWNAAEANVVGSVDTTAGTSGINLSLSSGTLDVTISSGSVENNNTNFVTGGTVYSTTSLLAPKASPEFTGNPTAPTVSTASDNSTKIATTAFVQSAISAASSGAAVFKGVVNAGSTISGLTAYSSGWYWVVGTAGTYVGEVCEVGDFIFCVSNYSSAYSNSDFSVVQNNIEALSDNDIDGAIDEAEESLSS